MAPVEGSIEQVIRGEAAWCIVRGDALHVLRDLPDGRVDASVTDPPYSSGGAFRGDRVKETTAKYVSTNGNKEINREWAELARADVSGSDFAARAKGQQALFGWV